MHNIALKGNFNEQVKPTGPDAMTLQQECAEIWKVNGSNFNYFSHIIEYFYVKKSFI